MVRVPRFPRANLSKPGGGAGEASGSNGATGSEPFVTVTVHHDAVCSLLTPRQIDILVRLAHGDSNEVIARRLGLSKTTVKNYISTLLGKLEAQTRTQAVMAALQHGWITLDATETGLHHTGAHGD